MKLQWGSGLIGGDIRLVSKFNLAIVEEWRGLAVSIKVCHCKGRKFEFRQFLFFSTLKSNLHLNLKSQRSKARRDDGDDEEEMEELAGKCVMVTRKDKMVRRRQET